MTTSENGIETAHGIFNNIAKMRQFQLKGYTLQAYDKKFKPTPPGFNPDIVLKKINGEDLYE